MKDSQKVQFKAFLRDKGAMSIVLAGFRQAHGTEDWEEYLDNVEAWRALRRCFNFNEYRSGVFDKACWNRLNVEWRKICCAAFEEMKAMFKDLYGTLPKSPRPDGNMFALSYCIHEGKYLTSALNMRGFVNRYEDDEDQILVCVFNSYGMRDDFLAFMEAKLKNIQKNYIYYEKLPQIAEEYLKIRSERKELEKEQKAYARQMYQERYQEEEADDFDESMVISSTAKVDVVQRQLGDTSSRFMKANEIRMYYGSSKSCITVNQYVSERIMNEGMTHMAVVEMFNGYIGIAFNSKGEGINFVSNSSNVCCNSKNLILYLQKKLKVSGGKNSLEIADLGLKGDYYTIVIKK